MLRTPYLDELQLKAYIARLAVALEAHAVSSPSTDLSANNAEKRPSGGQTRDVIWMGKVDTSEDPVIVVEEAEDADDSRDMFLIWKLNVFLSRFFDCTLPQNILTIYEVVHDYDCKPQQFYSNSQRLYSP